MNEFELPDGRVLRVFQSYTGGYFVGWTTSAGYRKHFKALGASRSADEMRRRLADYAKRVWRG